MVQQKSSKTPYSNQANESKSNNNISSNNNSNSNKNSNSSSNSNNNNNSSSSNNNNNISTNNNNNSSTNNNNNSSSNNNHHHHHHSLSKRTCSKELHGPTKSCKLKISDNTDQNTRPLATQEAEVINLSSDDEEENDLANKPAHTTDNNGGKTILKSSAASNFETLVVNPNGPENNSQSTTAVVINDTDSESSTHTTTSSSQLSANYEAEDENESEMKAKQQTQQETQTQQHLMQVQTFLKSFDTIQQSTSSVEKSSLTELRNFRQTSKVASNLTKPGKFNISPKFLRKSRNKLKSQALFQNSSQPKNRGKQLQEQQQQQLLMQRRLVAPEPEDTSLNYCEESLAKLKKDFSIDSLLNN